MDTISQMTMTEAIVPSTKDLLVNENDNKEERKQPDTKHVDKKPSPKENLKTPEDYIRPKITFAKKRKYSTCNLR